MTAWAFHDFPDVEALTIKYLTENGVARVAAALPSKPSWPMLTVVRIGGQASPGMGADLARVQLDAWAATKGEARALMSQALTLLWQMPGNGPECVLDVQPDLGMSWQPDDTVTPPQPRYIAGVQITCTPS